MKHLKTYKIFEAFYTSGLTQEQEKFLKKYTKGIWTYNSSTGLVDVEGNFWCAASRIKDFKGINFGLVSGNFWCHHNSLTSLAGAPQKVGEDFGCQNNNLTSLNGAPQEVEGKFGCYQNKLISLAGAPQRVGDWFACDAFKIEKGEWNLKGWLKILEKGSPEAQSLILTLLAPDFINHQIQKDPAGMVMKLKEVWNLPNFKEIKSKLIWPRGYEGKMDLVGDLGGIGF